MRTLAACIQCHAPLPSSERVCPMCRSLQPSLHRPLMGKGTTIERGYGRIVVDTQIGRGGMGIVFRAWLFYAPDGPRRGEPPVAIALKVLNLTAGNFAAGHKAMARAVFLNEAEALQKLNHPNIVRFYDLFDHNEAPVLAMEYVDGRPLADVIASHVARANLANAARIPEGATPKIATLPGMPFRRAWHYFQQLLGALAATHELALVHRDVKPSNILLQKDGIAKLSDFGIASASAESPPGIPKGVAGTSLYMSPEQILAEPLDGRSDLYSAGIVLYEMLSGRTPFEHAESDFAIRRAHVEADVPSIRKWVFQAPPVLDALFRRALAKDRAHRFANAIEMGDAFREAFSLPKTPEWEAQNDIAKLVREAPRQTTISDASAAPSEARLATLREFVVRGYRTQKL